MGTPLADVSLVSTISIGKATCVVLAKPFHRTVTSIVVTNTLAGTVNVYRGSIGGVVVGTSLLGSNNTIRGRMALPAGQNLFIVWENAGSATARVSSERVDNPLEADATAASWDQESLTSFSVPTSGPPFVIFGDPNVVAPEVVAFYATHSWQGTSETVIAVQAYEKIAGQYVYVALTIDSLSAAFRVEGTVDFSGVHELVRTNIPFGANIQYVFGAIQGDGIANVHIGSPLSSSGNSANLSINQLAGFFINNGGVFLIDGISAPRGRRLLMSGGPSLTSAGAGTSTGVESGLFSNWTTGNTGNSYGFVPGRVYKVTVTVSVFNNGGNSGYTVRIRSTLTNTILAAVSDSIADNGHLDVPVTQTFYLHNATGSIVTTGFQITLLRTSCTTAGATVGIDGITIDIEDYAAVSDFNNVNFSGQVV